MVSTNRSFCRISQGWKFLTGTFSCDNCWISRGMEMRHAVCITPSQYNGTSKGGNCSAQMNNEVSFAFGGNEYTNVSPVSYGCLHTLLPCYCVRWIFIHSASTDTCRRRFVLGFPFCGGTGELVLGGGFARLLNLHVLVKQHMHSFSGFRSSKNTMINWQCTAATETSVQSCVDKQTTVDISKTIFQTKRSIFQNAFSGTVHKTHLN